MLAHIYDIALILIILVCIATGYKKGVLRAILNIACLVIAFSAASMLSTDSVINKIYDDYCHDAVITILDAAVDKAKEKAKERITEETDTIIDTIVDEHFDGSDDMREMMKEAVGNSSLTIGNKLSEVYEYFGGDLSALLTNPIISDKINNIALKYSSVIAEEINLHLPLGITVKQEDIHSYLTDEKAAEALIYELLGGGSDDGELKGIPTYAEKTIISPILKRIIEIVVWVCTYTIVNIILRVIVRIILVVRKVEPIKACDSLLGALLGAVGGVLLICAAAFVIVMVIDLTGGMTYINYEIIEQTIIFREILRLLQI